MRHSRRTFLKHVATAAALPVFNAAQTPPPLGMRPGEARTSAGIRVCWCPAGTFTMGSPATEPGHRADEAQVEVALTRGFWAGTFEVTQGEWRRLVGPFPGRRQPSAEFGIGDDLPMYWVSYLAAETFCTAATDLARRSGDLTGAWSFRMPTEAQWEYACRAGSKTPVAFGDRLGRDQANVGRIPGDGRDGPAIGRAVRVGSYAPNRWGLHDMHGNVWEWCRDYYHRTLPGGRDPDLSGTRGLPNRDGTYSRVRRGGAWIEDAAFCRSAARLPYEPDRDSDHIGFRIVVADS